MTTNKGGRPAKPTPKWNPEKGVWQVRVTMPKPADAKPEDEAPRKTVDLPRIDQEDVERAHRVAQLASDAVRRGEAAPLGSDETVSQWFERYYDAAADGTIGRKNRGAPQVSAGDRRARYTKWIAPIIGAKPMATITADALRPVVKALDAQIRVRRKFYDAGTKQEKGRKPGLAPKAARNIWGELTAGFREACTSKHDDLRVRSDDPTRGVQPPAMDEDREMTALYPSELLLLLAAPSEKVPVYRRVLYAVAAYAGLRAGELRGLTPADIDLEHDLVNVRRQNRAGTGKLTRTKTRAGRRQVPIEPALRPLLEVLVEQTEDGTPLLRVPPPEDCAELLRKDLIAAGCDREELLADDGERQHFTFHGLRHTCLTHWAVAGKGQQWLAAAGHTDLATTMGYVDVAVMLSGNFGQPHPPLPPELQREVSDGFGLWKPKRGAKFSQLQRSQRELNPCYRRERPVS
jgi:integrase